LLGRKCIYCCPSSVITNVDETTENPAEIVSKVAQNLVKKLPQSKFKVQRFIHQKRKQERFRQK